MPTCTGHSKINYVTTINWGSNAAGRNYKKNVTPKFLNTNVKYDFNSVQGGQRNFKKNDEAQVNENHSATNENSYFSLNVKENHSDADEEINLSLEESRKTGEDYEIIKKKNLKSEIKINRANSINTSWLKDDTPFLNNNRKIKNKQIIRTRADGQINYIKMDGSDFVDLRVENKNMFIRKSFKENSSHLQNKINDKTRSFIIGNEHNLNNNIVLEIKPSKENVMETIEQIKELNDVVSQSNSRQTLNQNLYSIHENGIYLYRTKSLMSKTDHEYKDGFPLININRRPSANNNMTTFNQIGEIPHNNNLSQYSNNKNYDLEKSHISRTSDESVIFTDTSSLSENDKKRKDTRNNNGIRKQQQFSSNKRKDEKTNIQDETLQSQFAVSDEDDDSLEDDNLKIDQKGDLKFFIKPRKLREIKKKEETIEDDIDEEKLKNLLTKLIKTKNTETNNNNPKKLLESKEKTKSKKTIKTEESTGDKDKSGTGGGLTSGGLTGGEMKNIMSTVNQNRAINTNYYPDQHEQSFNDNNNTIIENTFQSTMLVNDASQVKDFNTNSKKKNLNNQGYNLNDSVLYDGPYNTLNNNILNNSNSLNSSNRNDRGFVKVNGEHTDFGNQRKSTKTNVNYKASIKHGQNNLLKMNEINNVQLKSMETTTSDLVDKKDQTCQTLNEQQTQTESPKAYSSFQTQTEPVQYNIANNALITNNSNSMMTNGLITNNGNSMTNGLITNNSNSMMTEFLPNSNLIRSMPNTNPNGQYFYRMAMPPFQAYNGDLRHSINYNSLGKALIPIMNEHRSSKLRLVVRSPKTKYISADQLHMLRGSNDLPNNKINSKSISNSKLEDHSKKKIIEEYNINSDNFSNNFEKISLMKRTNKYKYLENTRKPVKFINS